MYRVQLALYSDASESAVSSDQFQLHFKHQEIQMSNLTITQRREDDLTIIDLEGKVALGETNRQLHEALRALVA